MSMDKGLRPKNALARHRNVLTRDERVTALKDVEKWTEEMGVLGLPKVAHRKMAVKKVKDEAAAGEGAVAAEGAAPAAPAAAEAAKKPEKKADKKGDKK